MSTSYEHQVVGIAALGQFTGYSDVIYRVYVPQTNGGRKSQRVCSNFGPLAVTYAHLINSEISKNPQFNLLLFTPITLCYKQESQGQCVGYESYDSLKDYGYMVAKQLLETINKSKGSCNDPTIPRIKLEEIREGVEAEDELSCSNKHNLPCQIVKEVCLTDGANTWKGSLNLVLMPLVGAFQHAIFREGSGSDIEKYPEALQAAIAYSLRLFAKRVKPHGATLFLDTTHSVNILATLVAQVVTQLMPILAFEWEIENENLLIYNSDPVVRETPRDIDVSYYYQVYPLGATLRALTYDIINNLGPRAKVLLLLEYGLIHFALFEAKYGENPSNKYAVQILVEKSSESNTSQGSRPITRVNYKIAGWTSLYDIAYIWLVDLIRNRIIDLMEKKMHKEGKTVSCLSYAERSFCVDLEYLMGELRYTPEESKYEAAGRKRSLLGELVTPMAKLIWFHEYDRYREDPGQRLQYLAPGILKSIEDPSLCEKISNKCIQVLVPQQSARNVVAHAGLTGAAYGMAFVFEKEKHDEKKCKLRYVCVADSYPKIDELLKYILSKVPAV